MLGLDIGSSAVKLVELSRHSNGYRLEACAIEPVAPGAIQDKGVHDVTAVAAAIRRAVANSGTRQRQVAAAVGGGTAMTKMITMPTGLSDLEMEEQIALEASQTISYPLDEVNLDFEVLGATASGDRMEVLLAASRSDHVDNHIMAVEMAGLELKVLDIEAYALENAFPVYAPQLPDHGTQRTVAVVDIGHSVTTMNVLQDGEGLFQQSQGFGCGQLLEALRNEAGMGTEEAMRHLRQGRLASELHDKILLPFRDSVVRQVHRVVQLFQSASQPSSLDHILLSGGGALLPEVAERVSEQTGISATPYEMLRPLEFAPHLNRVALQRQAPTLLVALGLGVRGALS
jgi:type IV pilus assembly protein PilM